MLPVAAVMILALEMISYTPTAANSEVSLYMRMNSLVMVGITRRTVCGMITWIMVWAPLIPSERDASNCPLGMDWMPARKISAR